jgi:hypothetical protein
MAGYTNPAFGARSKSEIDLFVFSCLIEPKAIDPDGPIFFEWKAIKGPAMVVSDQCDGSASSRCASHYWRADTVVQQNSISRAHVGMQRRRP